MKTSSTLARSLRAGAISLFVLGFASLVSLSTMAQERTAPKLSVPEAKVESNVIYGMYSGLALLMDVYHPMQSSNGLGVIFVHGGHWRMAMEVNAAPPKTGGNVVQLEAFIKPLVSAGYTVFVPDYRMAPRFHADAQLEDIQRAVRFVRFNSKRFGIDPDHLGGAGFSAGSQLISLVGLMDGKPTAHDTSTVGQTSSKLQCVVAAGTPANLAENAAVVEDDAFISEFIGDFVTPKNPPNSAVYKKLMDASPVTYVGAGAPPFLLIHAEQDTEIPIAIVEEFQQARQKAGGPVKMIRVPNSDHESTFVGEHATVFTGPMVQWYDQYLKGQSKTRDTGN